MLYILQGLNIIAKYKWFVLAVTLTGGGASAVIVLLIDETYKSTAVIKPPKSKNGSLAMLANMGGDLGDFLGDFMNNDPGEDDCINILQSTQFARQVIRKFNLVERYEHSDRKRFYMADVMKDFDEKMDVEVNDEDAIVISMRDKSPEMAAEMVRYMLKLLDSTYLALQKQEIRANMEYIDSVVGLTENKLRIIEDSLEVFQKRFNIYAPEIQIEATLKGVGELETQLDMVTERLLTEKVLKGGGSAKYKKLQIEKKVLEKLIRDKFTNQIDSSSLSLPLHLIPTLGLQYFRLERDYKIQLTVFKYLIKQAELLKLEYGKEIQQITIIDPPWVNDKKIAPPRRVLVEAVVILLFFMSSILCVLYDKWLGHKEKNSELYKQIKFLLHNLKLSRKN